MAALALIAISGVAGASPFNLSGPEAVSILCGPQALSREHKDAVAKRLRAHAIGTRNTAGWQWVQFQPNDTPDFVRDAAFICAYDPLVQDQPRIFEIRFAGMISDESVATVGRTLEMLKQAQKKMKRTFYAIRLNLNSAGGDVLAAQKLGRYMDDVGLTIHTKISPENVCASSCVILFAGGSPRSPEGKLVIHRMSLVPDQGSDPSPPEYREVYQDQAVKLKQYFHDMGVRPTLVDDMMRISSSDQQVLSPEQVQYYGLHQSNPYKEEQSKARFVAKCGPQWYQEYEQAKDQSFEQCSRTNKYADDLLKCVNKRMRPLYKQCSAYFKSLPPG
jgi:hypothetical protein